MKPSKLNNLAFWLLASPGILMCTVGISLLAIGNLAVYFAYYVTGLSKFLDRDPEG